MAASDLTCAPFAGSTAVLSDGDHSAVSDLAARRRAHTTVADADAAYRAELIADYIKACRNSDDEFAEYRLLAEAARYDREHPGDAVPLVDELHGTQLRRAA
jgi:hypothetical protein